MPSSAVLHMPRHRNSAALEDAFPGPLYRLDRDRRVSWVSRNYEQFTGITPNEVLGRTIAEVLGPETGHERDAMLDEVERTGEPLVRAVVVPLKTGAYWLIFVSPLEDGFACGLLPIPH
jgi:PAS domain-containing protein